MERGGQEEAKAFAEMVNWELLLLGVRKKKKKKRKLSICDQSDPRKTMLPGVETVPAVHNHPASQLGQATNQTVTNSGFSGQAPTDQDF